jgi:RimJ/RimL family protein N-acetyltransferase
MRFTRYGVTLERLEKKDIETVRQWRNSPWVRPYMRYQGFIHPQEQTSWFASLDPRCDWYFIAGVQGAPFALFHVKAIDWTKQCGESGGFVGSSCFIGRTEAAQATLALMDFAFLLLELSSLEAQYHPELNRVVRFNEQLGYRIFRHERDGFVRAHVTADRYFQCAATLRKAAAALHGTAAVLADWEPCLAPAIERRIASPPADFQLHLH